MTYLQMINKILVRLREDQITVIATDPYALLVGELVNDAVVFVEDAWNFSGLRETQTVFTVADQQNYPLTGLDNRAIISNVFNHDRKQDLIEFDSDRMRHDTRLLETTTSSDITKYARGYSANGVLSIDLLGIPTTTTELSIDVIRKSVPLSDESELFRVPTQPILYLAQAFAARERGEVQGQSIGELFAIADKYLSDAIAHDADNYQSEITWTVY